VEVLLLKLQQLLKDKLQYIVKAVSLLVGLISNLTKIGRYDTFVVSPFIIFK
jgi:hypothetical protein